MSEKTHPAEIFVRQTLLRNPKATEMEKLFLRGKETGKLDWPDWCGLPMGAAYAMITNGAPVAEAGRILAEGAGTLELSNLTAALLWRKSKTIFRYDPELLEAIISQPLDGEIPRDALYCFPYHCVFIERAQPLPEGDSIGFFAWMEWDMNNRMPELRLLYLLRSGYCVSVPVLLPGGTLADSQSALLESALKTMERVPADAISALAAADAAAYGSTTDTHVVGDINLVLYLCAENADMEPKAILERRRSRDSATGHATIPVGTRIGAALRKAKSAPSAPSAHSSPDSHHASPVPHIRRAHWHNFWTGPRDGERKLVLRWLSPIPVNATEDTPAVIIPIRTPTKNESEPK